jgi:hypothetical protein
VHEESIPRGFKACNGTVGGIAMSETTAIFDDPGI